MRIITDRKVNPYPYACIEVDLNLQVLRLFSQEELAYETVCCTGSKGDETPTGCFHVFEKYRDRCLRQPQHGKRFFVRYELSIDTLGVGILIHDAAWKGTLPEDFYPDVHETEGSDGCINVPLSASQYLYDHSPLGMPVIIKDNEDYFTDEYRGWKLFDRRYNPENEYSIGGEFSVCLAVLLRKYEIVKEYHPLLFNPAYVENRLLQCGVLNEKKMVSDLSKIPEEYGISFVGTFPYHAGCFETFDNQDMDHLYVLEITGKDGKNHFAALDAVVGDEIMILHSIDDISTLRAAGRCLNILEFRKK